MTARFRSLWSCALLLVMCGTLSAEEPAKLRYRFIKGDTNVYRTQSGLKQVQTMLNMTSENSLDQETITSRTVDEVDKSGNAHLTIQTERLHVTMKLGTTGDYEFDSKSASPDRESNLGKRLTPLYERLATARIQVVVSPRGEVKRVKGFNELVADVIKNNALAMQFAGGGTDAAARFATQESFVILKDSPVRPGEKWEVPIDADLPNVAKSKRNEQVTFVGLEQINKAMAARLRLSSDIVSQIHTDSSETKLNGTLSTKQSEGAALFEVKSGRLVSLRTVTTLSGQLTLEADKRKIPIQQEQTQTLEVELLNKVPD